MWYEIFVFRFSVGFQFLYSIVLFGHIQHVGIAYSLWIKAMTSYHMRMFGEDLCLFNGDVGMDVFFSCISN